MGTNHGRLTELGIEARHLHANHEGEPASQWVVDDPFVPVTGHTYYIAFGRIPFGGVEQQVSKHVRIDGPAEWFDLDEQKPLDRNLLIHPVLAFRELD